jgi:hypothetical protein
VKGRAWIRADPCRGPLAGPRQPPLLRRGGWFFASSGKARAEGRRFAGDGHGTGLNREIPPDRPSQAVPLGGRLLVQGEPPPEDPRRTSATGFMTEARFLPWETAAEYRDARRRAGLP